MDGNTWRITVYAVLLAIATMALWLYTNNENE